jgi:dihydroxy-acid dehydratase
MKFKLERNGRFFGGSHGFIVGHITPEAQEGGPIALVQTGDKYIKIVESACEGCVTDE